jgi:hypothetical protein
MGGGGALFFGDIFGVTKPNGLVLIDTLPLAHFLLDGLGLRLLRFLLLNFLHFRLRFVVLFLLLLLGCSLLLNRNFLVDLHQIRT